MGWVIGGVRMGLLGTGRGDDGRGEMTGGRESVKE